MANVSKRKEQNNPQDPAVEPEVEATEQETPPAVELADSDTLRWFGGPLALEGDELPEWIPIHRECDRVHPRFGRILMTKEKMQKAVANFRAKVLRPDSPTELQVPIDTQHSGDAACGWLTDMKIQAPFLLGKPDWNGRGSKVLRDKQFLYVSPLYTDSPETGPVFREVTLTNRDFLKMPPILGGPPILLDEGVAHDLSPLVWPALESFQPNSRRLDMPQNQQDTAPVSEPTQTPGNDDAQFVQLQEQMATVNEQLEQMKALADEQSATIKAQAAQLSEAEADARDAEVRALCDTALSRGVDAFTVNAMRSILLTLPRKQDDGEIALQDGNDGDKAFPSLYAALSYILQHVPSTVPTGEQTHTLDVPPAEQPEDDESLDAAARALMARVPGVKLVEED